MRDELLSGTSEGGLQMAHVTRPNRSWRPVVDGQKPFCRWTTRAANVDDDNSRNMRLVRGHPRNLKPPRSWCWLGAVSSRSPLSEELSLVSCLNQFHMCYQVEVDCNLHDN
jgi:hypothetical protein